MTAATTDDRPSLNPPAEWEEIPLAELGYEVLEGWRHDPTGRTVVIERTRRLRASAGPGCTLYDEGYGAFARDPDGGRAQLTFKLASRAACRETISEFMHAYPGGGFDPSAAEHRMDGPCDWRPEVVEP